MMIILGWFLFVGVFDCLFGNFLMSVLGLLLLFFCFLGGDGGLLQLKWYMYVGLIVFSEYTRIIYAIINSDYPV